MLNILGIASGFYASYQVTKLWFGCIFIFLAFSLYKYSKNYKTTFLIGNLQVAFLTALSIILIALFDLIPIGISFEDGSETIFNIILFYAGFSFITTLIREIIKDLEDMEGDTEKNANTLAINYGISKTKNITTFLILIPIFGIGYFQSFQYSELISNSSIEGSYWWKNFIAALYTLFIQTLLITLLIKMIIANTKSDFHFSSSLCKIIMLVGVSSIPLFHFLYQN